MLGRLQGKTALVSGTSSGLGRAIALIYAREGANVICSDISPAAKATKIEADAATNDVYRQGHIATHELIQQKGGKAIFAELDVGSANAWDSVVQKAVKEFGRLDVLINNAGVAMENSTGKFGGVAETDEEIWDATLRVNAKGVFLGCRAGVRQMLKQDLKRWDGNPDTTFDEKDRSWSRGWIINIASILGLVGWGGGTPSYHASKGAVVNLTRSVAQDYAAHRIHCNAVCPGFTASPMTAPLFSSSDTFDTINARHPLKGVGEPTDIAKACVFLASDDANWITGVPLPVDGGYTAR